MLKSVMPESWLRAQRQYDAVMLARQNQAGASYWCYYSKDVLEDMAITMIQNAGCKVQRVSKQQHPHEYLITWEVGRGGSV